MGAQGLGESVQRPSSPVKRGNLLGIQIVPLSPPEIHYAHTIAIQRNAKGTTSRTPDSGFDPIRVDLIGTMAEIAVCVFYGEDYTTYVVAHDNRPGAIPDVMHRGYKVSVKGRDRWEEPLDLVVPEHDVQNDIFILVSVDVEEGICGLRGWVTRKELLQHPAEEWKWTNSRPGATKRGKKRRYVPLWDLRPCKRP